MHRVGDGGEGVQRCTTGLMSLMIVGGPHLHLSGLTLLCRVTVAMYTRASSSGTARCHMVGLGQHTTSGGGAATSQARTPRGEDAAFRRQGQVGRRTCRIKHLGIVMAWGCINQAWVQICLYRHHITTRHHLCRAIGTCQKIHHLLPLRLHYRPDF